MPLDKISDLIDQLIGENDPQKQRVILAEVSKLLREERERRDAEKTKAAAG